MLKTQILPKLKTLPLQVLAISACLVGVGPCATAPGFTTPEGVMLLARNSLLLDQYDQFSEALTREAYVKYGDPEHRGDHHDYETLRREFFRNIDAVVSQPTFLGTDQGVVNLISHYRIHVTALSLAPVADFKIDCEHRSESRYCRISQITLF